MTTSNGRLVGVMNARNRPKTKTADDVHTHIFDAIVDQRLLPGTKLTEMSLMEAFGLSRRAIGAALQRLAWERLVVVFANRGAYVAAPSADEAREIFAARITIEAGTTEAVAARADPQSISLLKDIVAREATFRAAGRIREAIHLSGGFHVLMAELSGNSILAEQVRLLVARTSLVVNLFENHHGLECWKDHHSELIHLCEIGDAKSAVALMRMHLEELMQSFNLDQRRLISFDMVGVFGTGS